MLDERRVKFRPNHYRGHNHIVDACVEIAKDAAGTGTLNTENCRFTDAKEVWFAGAHGDVGGGSVKNDAKASLARIPLRWMIRECFLSKTGIQFDAVKLEALGLDPSTLWPDVKEPIEEARTGHGEGPLSFPAPSELESKANLADIQSPSYDQLRCMPFWWILEYLPMRVRMQQADGRWRKRWILNRGRARLLPRYYASGKKSVSVHRSVQIRTKILDADGVLYKPKMSIDSPVKIDWVD